MNNFIGRFLSYVLIGFYCLISAQAYAQTAAILPPGKTTFFDSNGNPLTAGTVTFYIPSTTTLKTTWQDAAETVPNTNPVVLDAAGRAVIYGSGSYRQIVKDRNNNTIWDQLTSSTGTGGGSSTVGDGDLVGTVKPWVGLVAPNQYLFAYGQEILRATYPVLLTAITSVQTVFCTSGNSTLSGLGDTTQLPIGGAVEAGCIPSGTTVVSKTSTTVVVSNNANVSTNVQATFYPWGNGNGTTTFNLPDLRGRVIAGRDNMGGTAANRLTSTYFGTTADALGGVGGAESHALITAELASHGHTAISTASSTGTSTATSTATSVVTDPGHLHSYTAYPVTNVGTSTTAGGAQTIGTSGAASTGTTLTGISVATGVTTTVTTGVTTTVTTGINNTGSGTAFAIIQPTITTNYIIKVSPDTSTSVASGVASISGMTGVLVCGTGLTCTSNTISANTSNTFDFITTPIVYGGVAADTTLKLVSTSAVPNVSNTDGINIQTSNGLTPFAVSIPNPLFMNTSTFTRYDAYGRSMTIGGTPNTADTVYNCNNAFQVPNQPIGYEIISGYCFTSTVDGTGPAVPQLIGNNLISATAYTFNSYNDNNAIVGTAVVQNATSGGAGGVFVGNCVVAGYCHGSEIAVSCQVLGFAQCLPLAIGIAGGGANAPADAMIAFQDFGATAQSGIRFEGVGTNPFTSTANLLYVTGSAISVSNGINFAGATFSACAFISHGICIDGNGNVGAANLSAGSAGSNTGSLVLVGLTSGQLIQTVPTVAGTPTVTWGSNSGVPVVTASTPLAITAATGDITCATCLTTANIGTSGHTLPYLDGTNTWSAVNTFTTTSPSVAPVVIQSTDAGATQGPLLSLDRFSASPAANDVLAILQFNGRNSSAAAVTYASVYGTIGSATASSETGFLNFATNQSGTLALRGFVGVGLVIGSPTGSDKGAGTINAVTLYQNGTALATVATSASASDLSTGTMPSGRLTGSYTGITGVGALATGSLTAGFTPVGAAFGGFGSDVSAQSGIPLFAAGTPTFTSTSGTGNFVRVTSPTLVTPTLGVATATSINGLTITSSTGTFSLTNAKTFSVLNTLTFTGTDSSSVAFGTGGTVAYTANNLSVFAATTSAQLAGVLSDETGTGVAVFGTAPTFTTNITVPLMIGGTSASQTFELRATSGNDTGSARINLTAGNNGATVLATLGAAGAGTSPQLAVGTTLALQTNMIAAFKGAGNGIFQFGQLPGGTNYAGIWFLSATPTASNYGFLADSTGADPNVYLNAQASGAVKIGPATASASKTTGSLVNAGGFGNAGAIFTDTLNVITMGNTATTSAVCYNTGTGLLTYDGTLGTCTVSDERLKDVEGPITDALDKLLKINGFYYTWNDPSLGSGRQIGVGAQTVERVFPELVQTDSNGRKSADYQRLTAPIIEALRELKADNDNLKARLTQLENR